MSEDLQKILAVMREQFGDVDCFEEGNRATLYFRGSKRHEPRGAFAVLTIEIWRRKSGWEFLAAGMSIPVWDALRQAGIDVSDVGRTFTRPGKPLDEVVGGGVEQTTEMKVASRAEMTLLAGNADSRLS